MASVRIRKTLARKRNIFARRGRHFFTPTFRDKQLWFSGTARIFSGTSARSYDPAYSRAHAGKNRMIDKTKDSLLVHIYNFCFRVRPFFSESWLAMASVRIHKTLARKRNIGARWDRHFFPPTFWDEQLSFSGTSVFFRKLISYGLCTHT